MKIGTMLSEIPFINFPIILKNSGFDFFIIDNEHGAFDYSVLSQIIMTANLAGIDVIIRLSDNSRKDIIKFMDMGVTGLLLPMTNNRNDIEEVVRYAKYKPIGNRGISTTRMHTMYDPPPLNEYMKYANEKTKIYAQIETVSGVNNSMEIMSTSGVDGVFIGPNDLACDLNCIGDKKAIFDMIKKVSEAAGNSGKPYGIITNDSDYISFAKSKKLNMLSYGSELNMIIQSCKNIIKEFSS